MTDKIAPRAIPTRFSDFLFRLQPSISIEIMDESTDGARLDISIDWMISRVGGPIRSN